MRNELRDKSEKLRCSKENCKRLASEKQLLEKKILRIEKSKADEVSNDLDWYIYLFTYCGELIFEMGIIILKFVKFNCRTKVLKPFLSQREKHFVIVLLN